MNTIERSYKKVRKLTQRTEVFLVNKCTPRKSKKTKQQQQQQSDENLDVLDDDDRDRDDSTYSQSRNDSNLFGDQSKTISFGDISNIIDFDAGGDCDGNRDGNGSNCSGATASLIRTSENGFVKHSALNLTSLPKQIRARFLAKPFEFSLMVVGNSGLGKSTLINSLFHSQIYGSIGDDHRNGEEQPKNVFNDNQILTNVKMPSDAIANDEETVSAEEDEEEEEIDACKIDSISIEDQGDDEDGHHQNDDNNWIVSITKSITTRTVKLCENSVMMELTLVDTPGFGELIDNSDCLKPIESYIEKQYQRYFIAESSLYRRRIADTRVHCCLYFIEPNGKSMRPLDIECMKRLHDKVNIIPLIAKADTLTPDELRHFKRKIMETIEAERIKIYRFAPKPISDDIDSAQYRDLVERVPFGVVGSNHVMLGAGGRRIRCRRYPWGVVEIDNLAHCDFTALSDLLLKHSLVDLISRTADYYEVYRAGQLSAVRKPSYPTRL